jgi:hypothetical protein
MSNPPSAGRLLPEQALQREGIHSPSNLALPIGLPRQGCCSVLGQSYRCIGGQVVPPGPLYAIQSASLLQIINPTWATPIGLRASCLTRIAGQI